MMCITVLTLAGFCLFKADAQNQQVPPSYQQERPRLDPVMRLDTLHKKPPVSKSNKKKAKATPAPGKARKARH